MPDLLVAYRGLLRVGVATALAYRVRLGVSILTSLFPLVLMAVWLTLVDEVGPAQDWGREDFASYYVAAALLFHLTNSYVTWLWDADLRSGDLNYKLLKPVAPAHTYLTLELGLRVVTLAAMVPFLAVVTLTVDAVRYTASPVRLLGVLAAVALGYLLSCAMASCFAMLGFWSTQAGNVYALWWGAGAFLSGFISPLSLFPGWLQAAAQVLPFRNAVGFPIELLLGRLDGGAALFGFAVGAAWLAAFALAYRALWRRGLRHYQAVGG